MTDNEDDVLGSWRLDVSILGSCRPITGFHRQYENPGWRPLASEPDLGHPCMNSDNRVLTRQHFKPRDFRLKSCVFSPISISPSFMFVFIEWLIEILCIAQRPQPGEDITPFFVETWSVELTAQKRKRSALPPGLQKSGSRAWPGMGSSRVEDSTAWVCWLGGSGEKDGEPGPRRGKSGERSY